MKMKYEHNEVHDKTIGKIVRGGYRCNENEVECKACPFDDLSWKECSHGNDEKRKRVIEYIAEEVAETMLPEINFIDHWRDKYPVDEQTAKEIADAARVLLEGEKTNEAYENKYDTLHPTTADAFYVYNADLVKCATVSHEQGDDIIDIFIDNEMDIATARVFCEKLSTFLRSFGGEK